MMSSITKKRLAGALAVLSLSMLTLGCDDDYDDRHHHPHHPPRHTERDRDHHRHPDNEHRRHRDEHRNRDQHRNRNDGEQRQRPDGEHHRRRRPTAALAGTYTARALNDAVAAKGTTFTLDVVQRDDTSLALMLPSGKQYPISFNADTGTGTVAGGSLTPREDGMFVYRDVKGGIWLIEKQ